MRLLLLAHRYLGIGTGLLMTVWCLSGFVMLYVAYPELTAKERLRGLEPLSLSHCCDLSKVVLPDTAKVYDVRVESLLGRPVLRLRLDDAASGPRRLLYDLSTGASINSISRSKVEAIARAYAAGAGIKGAPRTVWLIGKDQWTIQLFRYQRLLYRVDFDDVAKSTVYVSGATGEVVQDTTGAERMWNWVGAIPHWLYPTILRQHGALWAQVVIWSSVLGTFLTLTGLYIGLSRLRLRAGGQLSPYRGLPAWHHLGGLLAGVFTLTWILSGLLSMNPWGALEPDIKVAGLKRLSGAAIEWGVLKSYADPLSAAALAGGTVEVAILPLAGRPYLLTTTSAGDRTRFALSGEPAPLSRPDIRAALSSPAAARLLDLRLIRHEDDYYYAKKHGVTLPAYRAVLADPGRTLLYIDPVSGELLRAVDRSARSYRWLHHGLHSFDFAALRNRSLQNVVVLLLLAGVTLVCATGAWMGMRRLSVDARRRR